jgi:hypothetical protein
MVLLSLTLTADTALLPVFFDLPGRTHWRLLQYSVTGSAVAVELPWLGAQLRSVNPGGAVAQAGMLQLQPGTFVCMLLLPPPPPVPPISQPPQVREAALGVVYALTCGHASSVQPGSFALLARGGGTCCVPGSVRFV